MDISSVQLKLNLYLKSYFEDKGYSEQAIKSGTVFNIAIEESSDFFDISLYAELDIEDFFSISGELDSIISKFEPSAYFDIISPGIYVARLYKASIVDNKNQDPIFTSQNLIKLGEWLASECEDELNEEVYLDNIEYNEKYHKLLITLSSDNYIAKCSISLYDQDYDSYREFFKLQSKNLLQAVMKNIEEI